MSRVQSPSPTPNFLFRADFSAKLQLVSKRSATSYYHGGMIPIKCRGVLFDLDGVLVDSTPAVARVWAGWAREHGFDPDEVVKKAHGRPSITTIRELLPNADHVAEDREVERREIADTDGVIPLPGALELLQALPLERWAIVTSCTRALAHVRIAAAGLPKPKHLVTATDVKNGKPDPEPYLKGAQFLGVPASECIVFEDAPAGIRAGKAAAARVLALRTTAPDAELQQAGADWIVDNCADLFLDSSVASEAFLLLVRRTK
jgi:mannitol-1-/sugar-/sorbitol-6-phosphatase